MHLLIFDLDGTLVDSTLDLANAVNAAREHMGLPALPVETVAGYVGNGAPVLIRRAMGPVAPEPQVEQALSYFLAYYRAHMLDHTRPYPGVIEALEALHGGAVRMAVLTNKPVRFSRDLIAGLNMDRFFFQVYGGNSFLEKKPHPMGILALIAEAGVDAARTWMIGDSAIDVLTARNAGVRACGVTYGISPESLKDAPPDLLLDSLLDLPRWILHSTAPAPLPAG
jgi:phosphoglycolate phosphatase